MKYFLISCFLLFCVSAFAQTNVPKGKVQIMARAQKDAIVIRIAPGSPTLWQLANKYGYYLERFTVARDGKIAKNRERILLTPGLLKPMPLADWEKPSDTNDLVAIAAQAIYGETFDIDTQSASVFDIYNKVQETESRYSFALLAADFSPEAAQLSGLYYQDKSAKKNEKYLYRVFTAVPTTSMKIDTASIYIGLGDYVELPQPQNVSAQFADHRALIRWDTRYVSDFYSAYWIERSIDKQNWAKTTDLPVLNTYEGDSPKTTFYYQLDSLPQNGVTYYYRIKGINSFGELGPPSEIIEGVGGKSLAANPAIIDAKAEKNQIAVTWEFPNGEEDAIKGFKLERSQNANSGYTSITDILPKSSRKYVDTKPLSTNYYRVRAMGNNKEESVSFPFLRQLEDSIPPASPVNLKGSIDTTGIVTLTWTPNQEQDLLGYRVYSSHFRNSEFSQVTVSTIDANTFKETIPLTNLTGKIYYKLQAVDRHFNPSEYSTILELEKPDRVPPVPPVIKYFKTTTEGIHIGWVKSSSQDVANHVLYRRLVGRKEWTRVKSVVISDTSRTTLDVPPTADTYEYAVAAVDTHNLQSTFSNIVKGRQIVRAKPAIQKVKTEVDRSKKTITLSWIYTETNVEKYEIYRAVGEEKPSLLAFVKDPAKIYVDDDVEMNSTYRYFIKAVFKNGVESDFSRQIEEKY